MLGDNNNKKCFLGVVILQCIFLLGMGIFACNTKLYIVDADVANLYSDVIVYDNGWYIDEQIASTLGLDGETNLLYGPSVTCPKGTYTVTIHYSCDIDQNCLI